MQRSMNGLQPMRKSLGRRLRDLRLILAELRDLRRILAVSDGEQSVFDEGD